MEEQSLVVEQENEGLSNEERENLLKEEAKNKAFAELCKTKEWEKVKDVLKEDIYTNLHFSKDGEFYHACWGIKMCIDRIEARANAYPDIVKKLMEDKA